MTRITRIVPLLFLLNSLFGVALHAQTPSPLPTGNTGIASRHPGDVNIQSDPAVLFADNFESYGSVDQLWNGWNNIYQQQYLRIASEPANVFLGSLALEMKVPRQSSEVANAVVRNLSPTQDTVFLRVYTKFQTGYDVLGSVHNGIAISANYCCPGVPANGTNKFLVNIENSRDSTSTKSPGPTNAYVYYPEQRDSYGDHWFPDGTVIPFSNTPGNFGSNFISRPNFTPELNRWYSYELMVKANTPGQRDGRVAVWIDGNLIADWQNVRLRDVSSLKISQVELDHYIKSNSSSTDFLKWYDNVVIATSYIGPVSGSTLVPPSNLTATVK